MIVVMMAMMTIIMMALMMIMIIALRMVMLVMLHISVFLKAVQFRGTSAKFNKATFGEEDEGHKWEIGIHSLWS